MLHRNRRFEFVHNEFLKHGDFTRLGFEGYGLCSLYCADTLRHKSITKDPNEEFFGKRNSKLTDSAIPFLNGWFSRRSEGRKTGATLSTPHFCSFVVEFCYGQIQTFKSILHVTSQDVLKYFCPCTSYIKISISASHLTCLRFEVPTVRTS